MTQRIFSVRTDGYLRYAGNHSAIPEDSSHLGWVSKLRIFAGTISLHYGQENTIKTNATTTAISRKCQSFSSQLKKVATLIMQPTLQTDINNLKTKYNKVLKSNKCNTVMTN
jgi:hypothetical protein